jgi:hypothetical protein
MRAKTMATAVQQRIERHLRLLGEKGAAAAAPYWLSAAQRALGLAGLDPAEPGAWATVLGAVMAGAFPPSRRRWDAPRYCRLITAFADIGGRDWKAGRSDVAAAKKLVEMAEWSDFTFKSLRTILVRGLDRNENPGLAALMEKDARVRERVAAFEEERAKRKKRMKPGARHSWVEQLDRDLASGKKKMTETKTAAKMGYKGRRRPKKSKARKSKLRAKVKSRKAMNARKSKPKIRPTRQRKHKAKSRARR